MHWVTRALPRRNEGGAAAVEFALVMPILLMLIFGLVQYGMYFYSAQTGSNTVNAAARQVSVGNCQTSTELEGFVNARLGAAKVGTPTVTRVYKDVDGSAPDATPYPANVEIGGTVTLTIEFDTLNMNFPLVPFLDDPSVSRTVVARIEDTTSQGCGA
jgi:Flp pilus assembly protein TadG